MKTPFNRILYGGDYNPNQWPREIWDEDMRLFKQAGINSATINVFSWAKLQPDESTYDFSELDDIVDMLSKEGYDIVIATSTAAMPAWLCKKYPEVTRVDYEGRRHKFGHRHNHCPNSLVFQKYARKLVVELAKRYGSNPHVTCWHIGNEYGGELLLRELREGVPRVAAKEVRHASRLSTRLGTPSSGATPSTTGTRLSPPTPWARASAMRRPPLPGISIDYRRFMSDSLLENFKMERDAIREYDKETAITTNLMGTYKGLDYFKWAKEMDIVSWDSYPAYDTPWSMRCHAQRFDARPERPALHAHGADPQPAELAAVQLLEAGLARCAPKATRPSPTAATPSSSSSCAAPRAPARSSTARSSAHSGSGETRVFKEVLPAGRRTESPRATQTLGADNPAQVGILFDWDNYWALEYTSGPTVDLKYVDQIHQYYRYFYDKHIPVDMVPVDGDFSKYQVIVAPVLYMVKEGMAEALERFVENGGTLVTGFMSGIVDQSDNVHLGGYPGPLRKMCGIWAEEIDALAPEQTNTLRFTDGTEAKCSLLCDIIHLEGAQALATYGEDFYEGTPAVTKNAYGKGTVYYVGTQPEAAGLDKILDGVAAAAGVERLITEDTPLEIVKRVKDGAEFWFILNLTGKPQQAPQAFAGETDILTGATIGDEPLKPFDTLLVRR